MKKIDGDGATLGDRMEHYPCIGMVFFLGKKEKKERATTYNSLRVSQGEREFVYKNKSADSGTVNNKSQMSKKRQKLFCFQFFLKRRQSKNITYRQKEKAEKNAYDIMNRGNIVYGTKNELTSRKEGKGM